MLSDVLSNFLDEIEADPSSRKNQAAARDARLKLTHEAKTQACFACGKAGWIAAFKKVAAGYEELDFTLAKCAGGVVLQPSDGVGYLMPAAPFFCSVKDEDGGGGGGAAGRSGRGQSAASWETERGG